MKGKTPFFEPLDIKGHEQGQFVLRLRGQNTFVDSRDGKVYRTVELFGQTWMAQNLDFDVGDGCYYYSDDSRIGKIFGRLYTWEAALRACPPGWRLPTIEEIEALIKNLGSQENAYNFLIEGGESGFSAQLGGYRGSNGNYYNLGKNSVYWSSTEGDDGSAWFFFFNSNNGKLYRNDNYKTNARSVRCIKDSPIAGAASNRY